MAPRGSGTLPPHLSRKKKEIIDKSMALFQQSLDRCLDNTVSAPANRRTKRARDDEESAVEQRGLEETGLRTTRKKRVKRDTSGRKYACPFSKHDPGKYKNVKTCCGPGWDDVHRVKEHVYRSHSLKNYCPRCFERFDKPEALQSHQRADIPCKLQQKGPDVISEEQEKQLRARAKANCSEDVKWKEMYQAIFPKEDVVPSPYYDSEAAASAKAEKSRFKSMEECREFIRTQLPLIVRPLIEQYVDGLFEDLQKKVNQKTAEIMRDVEVKMFRTFQFQEEQSATTPVLGHGSQPNRAPTPEAFKVGQLFDDLRGDQVYLNFFDNFEFSLEDVLAGAGAGTGTGACNWDNLPVDSAYGTESSNGDSYGAGSVAYVPEYM